MKRRATLRSLPPHEGNLYEAVARYVEHANGNVAIIGGIEIQQWPDDEAGKYRVAVSFAGSLGSLLRPSKN